MDIVLHTLLDLIVMVVVDFVVHVHYSCAARGVWLMVSCRRVMMM